MKSFRTEIELPPYEKKMEYNTPVMFIGSCFSTNIGSKFEQARLNTLVNPYGVIYNPYSVANTIRHIMKGTVFTADDLNFDGELWHSFYHHSEFSNPDKEACLRKMNEVNIVASGFLKKTKFLFITFGTSWVYQSKAFGYVVSNCHKYPARDFNRYILSIDDIVKEYDILLEELFSYNSDLQVVFTVSPVRHWKDGAHGNQLSKSTLLLAIDTLVNKFNRSLYFPAYELIMDDLRDYRFYADDMLHPNNLAIEYIWEKFKFCFFSTKTLEYIRELINFNKAIQHKPFDLTSESYQRFIKNQLEKASVLKNKYPDIDLDRDIQFFLERKN